jgi:hypothetical protein
MKITVEVNDDRIAEMAEQYDLTVDEMEAAVEDLFDWIAGSNLEESIEGEGSFDPESYRGER